MRNLKATLDQKLLEEKYYGKILRYRGKSITLVFGEKDQELILCNSSKTIFAINPSDGSTVWERSGGGLLTVCNSKHLLVHAKDEHAGLIAYQFKDGKIKEKWRIPKLTKD